jgi:uncharacterized membrane protein HdeD (DUF308 family)
MTLPDNLDFEIVRRKAAAAIHAHWKLFLVQGVLMLVLGTLAIALPNISTLEIELLIGWLFIVGGLVRTVTLFKRRHLPGFWLSFFIAVLAAVLGILLVARPLRGVLTLTLLMVVFFVIEGIGSIVIAMDFRRHLNSWAWTLVSGLINLCLAYMIWKGWPNTAKWVMGLFVGINMIFVGIPLIFAAIAARKLR